MRTNFHVVACRRSGHHAFIYWLMSQIEGRKTTEAFNTNVNFYNDTTLQIRSNKIKIGHGSKWVNHDPNRYNIYSYEERSVEYVKERIGRIQGNNHLIVFIRNPFDNLVNSIGDERIELLDIWKNHAQHHNIKYEEWVTNKQTISTTDSQHVQPTIQ